MTLNPKYAHRSSTSMSSESTFEIVHIIGLLLVPEGSKYLVIICFPETCTIITITQNPST